MLKDMGTTSSIYKTIAKITTCSNDISDFKIGQAFICNNFFEGIGRCAGIPYTTDHHR